MLTSTLLAKKRDGRELADEEIRFLVDGFCRGEVADYQMSAFAMAVCIRGMTPREVTTLTQAMLESGDRLPRLDAAGEGTRQWRVDKHSTGGLGDKVSLILAPLLASCDVQVPMISGRGLGFSGGTLDKLESIPGFQTELTIQASNRILADVGAFIVGADQNIAPADRQLYALRDVTGTVESIPLITASILSKKLAANLDALVIDVKTGNGAFMQTLDQARNLAQSLVRVGCDSGLDTVAMLSDMDQPLGHAVGNAVEVNESIEVLRGERPIGKSGGEVLELTIELSAVLLVQTGRCQSLDEARKTLLDRIQSGTAMERFEKLVHAQGGSLDQPLELAPSHQIVAPQDGWIANYNCRLIGETVVAMGGGRRRTGDPIDHGVGVITHGRIGDRVEKGQPILTVLVRERDRDESLRRLQEAVTIDSSQVEPRSLILERIDRE